VAYWRTRYDWRAEERRLNQFNQYTTVIDGLTVHFIHQRSSNPKALALAVTHGWPGSIAEFTKIIAPLTEPAAHGGTAADAFHVSRCRSRLRVLRQAHRARLWSGKDRRRAGEADGSPGLHPLRRPGRRLG
jgi:hypothetical protein